MTREFNLSFFCHIYAAHANSLCTVSSSVITPLLLTFGQVAACFLTSMTPC